MACPSGQGWLEARISEWKRWSRCLLGARLARILACPCRGWVMTGELTRMKLTSGQGWFEDRISEWKRWSRCLLGLLGLLGSWLAPVDRGGWKPGSASGRGRVESHGPLRGV